MVMLVQSVLSRVVMVVRLCSGGMRVFMAVFVQVLVGVDVRVFMRMFSAPM
jgi:hypothetical protein